MEEDLVLPNSIDAPVNYSQLDTPSIELQPVQASAYVPVTPLTRDKKQISPEEEASALRNKLNRIEVQDSTLDPAKTDSYSINKDRYNGFIIDPTKDQDFDLQASGQQTWVDRVMNDTVVFGAGLASGFGAAFTSIADMVKEQSFTPGVDSITASLADWKTEVDENHINFETQYDRDHPYLSMVLPAIFTGSSKGWGDMARSLSIGVGTGVGILTQQALLALATEGTGNVPALAATMRGVLSMRTGATAASMVGRLAQTVKAGTQAMNVTQKGLLAADLTKEVAQRYLMSMGEAEFEANETRVNFRANYIQDFVRKNGRIPTGDELVNVEDVAEKAHDARYTLNMATLMVTGGPFMKGVLKPLQSTRAFQDKLVEKGMVASLELAENSAGKIVFSKGKNLVGDFWVNNKIGKILKTPAEAILKNKSLITSIQGMEAIEEGLQFLYDKSVDNYYTSYLDNKTNGRVKDSILETALGIGKQLYKDKGLLISQEGIQSMISGVFAGTGQAMFTKALGQFKMGRDENGKYGIRYTGAKEREQYKADLESAGDNILEKISDVIGNHKSLKQTPLQSIQDVGSVATLDNMLGFTTHDIIQEQIRSKRVFDSLFSLVKTGQNEVALDILKKDMSSLSPVQFGQLLGVNITTEEEKRNLIESTTDSFNAVSKSYNKVQSIFRPPLSVAKSPEKSLIYNQLKDALTYHEYTATNLEGQITNRTSKSPLIVSTPESVAYMNGDVDFFKKLKKSKQDMMTAFNAIMPEAAPKDLTSQKDRVQGELDFIDDIIATIDEIDNKDAILDSYSKLAALTGTPFADSRQAEQAYMSAANIKYLENKHKTHIKTFDALVSAKDEDLLKVYTDYVLEAAALNDTINELVDTPEVVEEEKVTVVEEQEEEKQEEEAPVETPPAPTPPPAPVVIKKDSTGQQLAVVQKLQPFFDKAKQTTFVEEDNVGKEGSFYKLLNKVYTRVTNFIDPEGINYEVVPKNNETIEEATEKTLQSVASVKNSLIVGNIVDMIARGVFGTDTARYKYPVFLKEFNAFVKGLSKEELAQYEYLKNENSFNAIKKAVAMAKLSLMGEHTVTDKNNKDVPPVFITEELFASIDRKHKNTDGVGGKTDMLIVDGNGKLFIYDFKNVFAPIANGEMKKDLDLTETNNKNRLDKWTKQQTVYAAFIEEATGIKPEINIIRFATNYERKTTLTSLEQKDIDNYYPVPSDLQIAFAEIIFLENNIDNVPGLKELMVIAPPVINKSKVPPFPPIDMSLFSDDDKMEPTLESKVGASMHEVVALVNDPDSVGVIQYSTKDPDKDLVRIRKEVIRKIKTDKDLKLAFKERKKNESWEADVFNKNGENIFLERGLELVNQLDQPSFVLTYTEEGSGREIIVAEAKHPNRFLISEVATTWLKETLPESDLKTFLDVTDNRITLYDLYKESKRDSAEVHEKVSAAIWGEGVKQDYQRASEYVINYFEAYNRLIEEMKSGKDGQTAFKDNFELDYITSGSKLDPKKEPKRVSLKENILPLEITVGDRTIYYEGVIYHSGEFYELKNQELIKIRDADIDAALSDIVEFDLKGPINKNSHFAINSFKTYEKNSGTYSHQFIYRNNDNAAFLFKEALEAASLAEDKKDKLSAFSKIIEIKEGLRSKTEKSIVSINEKNVVVYKRGEDGKPTNEIIRTLSIVKGRLTLTDKVTGNTKEIPAYDPRRSISIEDFDINEDGKTIFSFVRPTTKSLSLSTNTDSKKIQDLKKKYPQFTIYTDPNSGLYFVENEKIGLLNDQEVAEDQVELIIKNNLKNETLDVSLPPEPVQNNSMVDNTNEPVTPTSSSELAFSQDLVEVGSTTVYVYTFSKDAKEEDKDAINAKLNSFKNNAQKARYLTALELREDKSITRKEKSAPSQRNINQIVDNVEEEVTKLKKQCHGVS